MGQGNKDSGLSILKKNFDSESRTLSPVEDVVDDLSQIEKLHPVRAVVVLDNTVKFFPDGYTWDELLELAVRWDERWAPALCAPLLRLIRISMADQKALDALDRSLDTIQGTGRLDLDNFAQQPGAAWFPSNFVSDSVEITQSKQVDFSQAGEFASIGLLSLGALKSVRGLAHLSQQGSIRLVELAGVKLEDPEEFWNIRAEVIAVCPRNRKEAAWFYKAWEQRPIDWMERVRFDDFLAKDLHPDWIHLDVLAGFYDSFEQGYPLEDRVQDVDRIVTPIDVDEPFELNGPTQPSPRQASAEPARETPRLEAISDEEFWALVQGSLEKAGGDEQVEALRAALGQLAPERIAGFEQMFLSLHHKLYDWGLRGVAYLLQGGCSDDAFVDVRSWIIGQGRDFYERCLADPRALASGALEHPEGIGDAELLAYVADEAYEATTGRDMHEDYPDLGGVFDVDVPTGEPWKDDEELEARFPGIEMLDW